MSTYRNFRITIILSNFFHDHRNRAGIFINDDIQTISDLENRIADIFHITNFHLLNSNHQNEFLPPSEDVRILEKDDIIWVVQNEEKHEATTSAEILTEKANSKKRSILLAEGSTEEELISPKKKKKRKIDLDQNKQITIELQNLLSEEPKKKKRKKKAVSETITEEVNDADFEMKNASTKKKKIKQSCENTSTTLEGEIDQSKKDNGSVMKINALLPVLHSHISSYNKKISRASKANASLLTSEISHSNVTSGNSSETELGDCKKDQYVCKGNLSTYKKSVPLPTITDQYLQQKKVNIVKIEFLKGSPVQISELGKSLNKNRSSQQDKLSVGVTGEENMSAPAGASNGLPGTVLPTSATKIPAKHVGEGVNEEVITSIPASNGVRDNFPATVSLALDTAVKTQSISEDVNKETPADKNCDKKNDVPAKSGSCRGITQISSILTLEEGRKSSEQSAYAEISPKKSIHFYTAASSEIVNNMERFRIDDAPSKSRILLDDLQVQQNPQLPKYQASNKTAGTNISSIDSCEFSFVDSRETCVPVTSIVNIETATEKDTYDVNKYAPNDTPGFESQNLHSNAVVIVPTASSKASVKVSGNLERGAEVSYVTDTFKGTFDNSVDISGIDNSNWNNISDILPKSFENDSGNPGIINNATLPSVSIRESTEFIKIDTSNPLDNNIRDSSVMDLTKDVANSFSSDVSRYSKRKQISGIGHLLEELRSNDSVVSVESVDSDCSDFITKRHRKRVRRRRKKKENDNSDTSLNSSLITIPIAPPKPLNVKACPSIHIKFEEGDNDDFKIIHKISRSTESEKESCAETSYIENITVNSDVEESKPDMYQVKEEDILKSPSMKGILPKVGDIIAFKILRITDNYTPEISSYIIGKVLEFNESSKQVVYEILNGLSQCEEPQGKLSIEIDAECNEAKDTKREMDWTGLIDPRLLYP